MSPTENARDHEGGSFEQLAGYSRGARNGEVVAISGTTVRAGAEASDTASQLRDALTRAIASLERLGGKRADIVRTRLLLAPEADWQAASAVHAELLGDIAPANSTYYVHRLIGEGVLVEVEIDAVLAR